MPLEKIAGRESRENYENRRAHITAWNRRSKLRCSDCQWAITPPPLLPALIPVLTQKGPWRRESHCQGECLHKL